MVTKIYSKTFGMLLLRSNVNHTHSIQIAIFVVWRSMYFFRSYSILCTSEKMYPGNIILKPYHHKLRLVLFSDLAWSILLFGHHCFGKSSQILYSILVWYFKCSFFSVHVCAVFGWLLLLLQWSDRQSLYIIAMNMKIISKYMYMFLFDNTLCIVVVFSKLMVFWNKGSMSVISTI